MTRVIELLLCYILLSHQMKVISNDNVLPATDFMADTDDPYDSGQPLYLTPLLQDKKIAEALNLSKVTGLVDGIESYSGFVTVDERFETNLFFWFVKANSENWESLPLLLWLQGGPGMTSLYALFCENGPFKINRESSDGFKLERRQYAWTDEYNIIYLDNPAGTGFSHTNSHHGYSKNQNQISNNLYKALLQFFTLFPELRSTDFFLTGESYAGKYIPALGQKIHNKNKKSATKINLTGLMIGNALVSPRDQLVYGDYLRMIGLIDEKQQLIFNDRLAEVAFHIDKKAWLNATDKISELFFRMYYPYPTLFYNFTGLLNHYNYIYDLPEKDFENFEQFITQPSTRKRIHVGQTKIGDHLLVARHLKADFMKSVRPQLQKLLEHYDVLFYYGQLDIICPYPGATNLFKRLKWSASEDYKQAERMKWYVGNKVAGYYKKAGRLTDVMIRNSGHLVPLDSPAWALNLIRDFVMKTL